MPSTRPIFWASVTASGRDGAHTRAWRPSNRPLMTQRVNWVLDLDIRTFFDSVDPGWLMRMLGHRIADPRVLRLIERWLRAGVLESGRWEPGDRGVPQGSGISPILANVFLHYVVDLWIHQWRRHRAAGQVIVCRYADDLVIGCQHGTDGSVARQSETEMRDNQDDGWPKAGA